MADATATGGPHSGRRVGHYRLLEMIGRGGMGEVYRGHDDRLNRRVAIKALSPDLLGHANARDRFIRETRMASKVIHPCVATVFDVVEDQSDLLLVMEYIDGFRFSTILREEPPSLDYVLGYAIEIGQGLSAIHKAGLIHRDLKPSNVMVTTDGHTKVLDFGVARPITRGVYGGDGDQSQLETTLASLTSEGLGVGTVAYMSPEQVQGKRDLDARSDLFSLGTILYEAITGAHPFKRDSVLDTASAIVHQAPGDGTEPDTLSNSGPLRSIVLRLLEKDREKRYPSAEQLVDDLQAVDRGSLPVHLPRALPKLRRPVTWLAGGAVVLAVAFAWFFGGDLLERVRANRDAAVASLPAAFDGPGVLVLPFLGPDTSDDASLKGRMLASVLRADLLQGDRMRIVGSTRTDGLIDGMNLDRLAPNDVRRLFDQTDARYLVAGRFDVQGDRTIATVDVFDRDTPNRAVAFNADDVVTAGLSGRIAREIRTRLSLETDVDTSAAPESIASGSESALMAAERGRQAFDRGDLNGASEYYAEATREDPSFVLAHMRRARVEYDAGYVNRAREAVGEAVTSADALDRPLPERLGTELRALRALVDEDREEEIRVTRSIAERFRDLEGWSDLAAAFKRANRNEEALAALDTALAERPMLAELHLSRSPILRALGRNDEARAAIESAERASEGSTSRRWTARLAMERGYFENTQRAFPAAREHQQQAARLYAELGEPLRWAQARRGIANTHLSEGDLESAIPILFEACRAFSDAGNRRREASCLDSLGSAHYQAGHLAEAETHYRAAVERIEETEGGLPNPVPSLNLASLLNYTGRNREAEPLAETALTLAKAQGDTKRVVSAWTQLAFAHSGQGNLDRAESAYQKALELGGRNGTRAAWALSGLSEVRLHSGKLSSAMEDAAEAVRIQEAGGQRVNLAYARLAVARLARLVGDESGFENELSAVEAEAELLGGLPDLNARCLLERGWFDLESGQPAQAEAAFREALEISEPAADLTGLAYAGLGRTLCESGRTATGLAESERAVSESRSVGESLASRNAHAQCLTAAGRFEDARGEALAVLDAASTQGFVWEEASGAIAALSLPESHLPAAREDVRRRGARALEAFLENVPVDHRQAVHNREPVMRGVKILKVDTNAS